MSYVALDRGEARNETGSCNGRVNNMLVTITTDGGFTGRGIGARSAEIDADLLGRVLDEPWQNEYRSDGADLVLYTLTVAGRTVSFTDGAELPPALRELFELTWRS